MTLPMSCLAGLIWTHAHHTGPGSMPSSALLSSVCKTWPDEDQVGHLISLAGWKSCILVLSCQTLKLVLSAAGAPYLKFLPGFREHLPGIEPVPLVASVLFYTPFVRDLVSWCGVRQVGPKL